MKSRHACASDRPEGCAQCLLSATCRAEADRAGILPFIAVGILMAIGIGALVSAGA